MKFACSLWLSTAVLPAADGQAAELPSVLESVIVTANRSVPTSLPTQIPTTMESVTREMVAQTVNATDSEDAIKYLPSLLVRKRYIGDYNHAVLSSRASGTGNSARSAVYADGMLLSNYLGNGATYAPRWALVTPEEIERVDVMYGPFSAAYPGNSVGAVVDYATRMPTQFEAHAKAAYVLQPFKLYNTDESYQTHQESASIGDRTGEFSWWLNVNHTHSHGQPLTFVTRPIAAASVGGTPVSGAVLDKDRSDKPWYILGTGTEYTTIQDHAKLKLAYAFTSTLRLSYLLGYWHNKSESRPQSYLHDAGGNEVYAGAVNIDGAGYTLPSQVAANATLDFNLTNEQLIHVMQGFSLKRNTQGRWDWEVAFSVYDINTDEQRTPQLALPAGAHGGAGNVTDQHGTGWNNLALKGVWRPQGIHGAHIVDVGYQLDHYTLRILKSTLANNWLTDAAGDLVTDVGGKARLQSVYAQHTWAFAPEWKSILGMRFEQWQAFEGYTRTSTQSPPPYVERNISYVSPKAAVAYQFADTTVVKASLGRAVRMPTVNELYGATTGAITTVNDPNLKPEKSWTGELSVEHHLGNASIRATGFYEVVKDSLYSDRRANGSGTVNRIINVGKITTSGVELSLLSQDVIVQGLEMSASVTYADSRIRKNDGYVDAQGRLSDATIGKRQPRVPAWRATTVLNYRINDRLNVAYAARYSGKQYSTLDNSDPNGFAYQGASKYFTTDVRIRYRLAQQWTAALGIDNLNNYKYWNFHPYPQRSYTAELQWDL